MFDADLPGSIDRGRWNATISMPFPAAQSVQIIRFDTPFHPAATLMTDSASDPVIRLDDFIKRSGLVGTGGEAKVYIQSGEVRVNGEVETRRRKQLAVGDIVELFGESLTVTPFEE